LNRSGKVAALMVVLLVVSLILLFMMPAESDEVADLSITYTAIAIYIASLAMAGIVVYYRRADGKGERPKPPSDDDVGEEYMDEISEIEKEFEALEKEIEREENS
jgi:amino acid transporter